MNPPAKPSGEDPADRTAEQGKGRSAGVLTRSNALQPSGPAFAKDLPKHTHYKAGQAIAHGGMGAVLEAEDQSLDRTVAMKVILPDQPITDDTYQRFLQEAKVLGKLEHPNIVPIHDLAIDEQGRVFYTMKLVRGVTLQHVLDEIRASGVEVIAKYPLSHLLTIFQKVCDAVAFAHSKGVLHRDLKPANIMIGEFGEVQVMDWGLAKVTERRAEAGEREGTEERDGGLQIENCKLDILHSPGSAALHTLDGQIMGSPNFMAPEQAAGQSSAVDERTDIYGLGGILYSILTLRPPIPSGSSLREMLDQIRRGEIRVPTEYNTVATAVAPGKAPAQAGIPHCPGRKVPAPLSAITLKALATRPEERYQRVSELQADIAAYQNGFVTSAEQPNPFLLAKLWIRRHRVAFGVISGFTLLAAIASVVVVSMWLELRGTASTFYDKSQALVAAGRFQEALPPIDYAIRLEPKNPSYHALCGNIQQSLLDIPKARAAYAAALQLDLKYPGAAENLQFCQRMLSRPDAGGQLPSEVLSDLHATMVAQGRLVEAQAILLKLLARDETARKEFLAKWQTRLAQGGLKGDLKVSESGRVELSMTGPAIRDVSTLQGMPLNSLNLDSTTVSNINALKGMPLDSLNITGGDVDDISALRGMPLVQLSLVSTKVHDLSPLMGMPLEKLNLQGSPVSDLRPLRGLPVRDLMLASTRVTDFAPLSGLTLEIFNVAGTAFWDTRLLQGMPLKTLLLSGTQVTNLAGLAGLPLTSLDLRGTKVKDLSPLHGLPLLMLQLENTPVEDLRPLVGMPLNWLDLRGTLVKDLTPLRSMSINAILLSRSRITDLSSLKGIEAPTLELDHTRISDLRPLEGMTIKYLFLEGCTGLHDVAPLARCEALEILTMPASATNIHLLRALPKLKQLGYTRPESEWSRVPAAAEFWKTYDAQHP